jgi:hypothetical protein
MWFYFQSLQDPRFPGRGRTLGSSQIQSTSRVGSETELQTRLLERSSQPEAPSQMTPISTRETATSNARYNDVPSLLIILIVVFPVL